MNLTAETFSLLATAIKLLGAGVAIGGGTIGSGIGIGLVVLGGIFHPELGYGRIT